MARAPVPLATIEDRFYWAMLASRVAGVLDPLGPQSTGRYHRHG